MGDRCSVHLLCREEHAALFATHGLELDEWRESEIPGCVWLVDDESYTHFEDWPDVPYIGESSAGCSYDATEFASDGEMVDYVETGITGGYLVHVAEDADGEVTPLALTELREFFRFQKAVKAQLAAMHDPAAAEGRAREAALNQSLTAAEL